jgi:hypothetical protein
MTAEAFEIRRATPGDAGFVQHLYQHGELSDLARRLANSGSTSDTSYYVAELRGETAALFALTRLGRLRPGSAPRFLLHEVKLKPSVRGLSVPEGVYAWLSDTFGAGRTVELIVLGPLVETPPFMADLGIIKAYHGFRWAANVLERSS